MKRFIIKAVFLLVAYIYSVEYTLQPMPKGNYSTISTEYNMFGVYNAGFWRKFRTDRFDLFIKETIEKEHNIKLVNYWWSYKILSISKW